MTPADLTAWRKRLGLTKGRAAQRLGIGVNTWARYEAGKAPVPVSIIMACKWIVAEDFGLVDSSNSRYSSCTGGMPGR